MAERAINSGNIDDWMWLSRMRYDLARNYRDKEGLDELFQYFHEFTCPETDNIVHCRKTEEFSKLFPIALTWALYLNRGAQKEKEKEE